MRRHLLAAIAAMLVLQFAEAQTAVGHWRDCLDYSLVRHVEPAGDYVYAAARGGLFRYDTLYGTVERLNKTTGLSDVGVATMAYDETTSTLVVAYNNSNIDLVSGSHVHNLSDVKRGEISANKTIHAIRFHNGMAYLATGFGVVVVDIARHEVKETLYIGDGGSYTSVTALAFTADSLYAATPQGIKRISTSEQHMGISDRWTADSRLGGVNVTMLDTIGNTLLAAGYESDPLHTVLYAMRGGEVQPWDSGEVRSMRSRAGRVAVSRDGAVVLYNSSLAMTDSIASYDWGAMKAHDAVCTSPATLWVGHEWGGLFRMRPGGNDYIMPEGPFNGDNTYRIVASGYRTMVCPGGHTTVYANSYLEPELCVSDGYSWNVTDKSNGLLDEARDVLDVAVDPFDTTHWVAAVWGTGLADIRDGRVEAVIDEQASGGALVPYTVGSSSTLRTGAVSFDRQGNLWTLLSNSTNALASMTPSGEWRTFNTTALAQQPSVDKLVCDSINGYLWFIGRDNIIYVHDGESRMARVDPNGGSKLQTDAVTALTQDHTGNLWLGTNKGIKVIYDGYRAFQNGGRGEVAPVQCSNITITNGEFYEYLMAYESITAIAVDGANRKWVGTSGGGLYLISSNGLEQLQHFTAENSPLFSNKIVAIAVQPRTGEVYIGTDQGLQVYRSTATHAESQPRDEVRVFPNPVRPGYDGPIAIDGFTRDGLVHVTVAAGHTVYTTQALGGQAVWYGRNLKGERVATGVYYVFAADNEGGNRAVGKILIVR